MNSLNHIAEDWPRHEVFSEDPYHSLWRELVHFAGRDAADRAMQYAPDRTKFDDFRNAMKLADEFWLNFEDAEEVVDAVPLYYGAYWLGMACAYVSLARDRLASIEATHGLTFTMGKLPQPFLNSNVGISRAGVFARINEAFGGEPLGDQLNVGALIAALPQLIDDLGKVNRKPEIIRAMPPDYMGHQLEAVQFPNMICVATIEAHFPVSVESLSAHAAVGSYLRSHNLMYDPTRKRAAWTGTRDRFDEVYQLCVETPAGTFLLSRIQGKVVSEFAIYVIVLYALSMFVRYSPNVWLRMIEDQTDEFFLIRSFILLAKKAVPQLALNHLTRQSWVFRTRD